MTDALVEEIDDDGVRGCLHLPAGQPRAALALTHGAGGNCSAKLLIDVATRWADNGVAVLRFDMAFRRAKPSGPPHPSRASGDRDSIRVAADRLRDRVAGPLYIGGHSYGGRQASMVVAEQAAVADGLVLLSYPLHPPGKPEKSRTAHLPDITISSLFVSGTKDPFGTPAELREAVRSVSGPTRLEEVLGAGHDISAAKHRVAERTLALATELFEMPRSTTD